MSDPDARSPQYQQHPTGPSQADSSGTRSSSGSNYGDWRPDNAEPLDTFAFRTQGGRVGDETDRETDGPSQDLLSASASEASEASEGGSQAGRSALNADDRRWLDGQMHKLEDNYRHWRRAQEQQLAQAFSLWRQAHPDAVDKVDANSRRSAQPGSASPGAADPGPDDENGHGVIVAGPAGSGDKPDSR